MTPSEPGVPARRERVRMRKTTMPCKTITILFLIGLLLSVGLWGASYFFYSFKVGIDDFLMIRSTLLFAEE